MSRYIIAAVILVVLVALFILATVMNKKTPKPAGFEDMKADCEGCSNKSCALYPHEGADKSE